MKSLLPYPDSDFKETYKMLLKEKHWIFIQKLYEVTPRELQTARLVCQGYNNDQIAKVLKIKNGTVKAHLRNIYRKVHVNSKITLLLRFIEDVYGLDNKTNIHMSSFKSTMNIRKSSL